MRRISALVLIAFLAPGCGGSGDSTPDAATSSRADARRFDRPDGSIFDRPDARPNTPDSGLVCDPDQNEVNNDEASATVLSGMPVSDCDDGNMFSGTGVVAGTGDADWYTYVGSDALCVVDPTATLSSVEPIRVCMYLECLDGTADFTCPMGTMGHTSPAGKMGCCGTATFTIDDLSCGVLPEEDANVWIRVDRDDADTCAAYTLSVHY